MAEVKAQPVRRVQAAALRHMIAQSLAQRFVQQVGGGMVGTDAGAAVVIHLQLCGLPLQDRALGHMGDVDEDACGFLGIGDPRRAGIGPDFPGIAHLAAAFGIERGLVHHDLHRFTQRRPAHFGTGPHQGTDFALGGFGVIAQKFGRPLRLRQIEPDRGILGFARAGPAGARLGFLFLHRGVEAFDIHGAALFAQRVLRQVQRKAIGIIKPERGLSGKRATFGQPRQLVVQKLQAPVQRLLEPGFFQPQRFLDQRLGARQFGIGRPHLPHQGGHQLVHHHILRAQLMGMAHRAAHDPAQHIAAPFVGRHHPIGDQERGRPQVVGNHAVMHLAGTVGIRAGGMRAGLDQAAHQVGVVIVMLALQQRADPLQPHAGVDRRLGQAGARAIGELLELHEHQVPDLDEPVAILFGAAGRTAPDRVAMIVKDFGAGAAGAGRAHHPEIVIRGDADDPVIGQAGNLFPDIGGLVIGMVDGDQQLVFRDAEFLCQQVPGKGNGLFLEVIAKAEIAQHLEKGVVAGGVADIVQVVVLAAGADAFLGGGGAAVVAGFDPGEQVLELHHA